MIRTSKSLDREVTPEYNLCVFASSDENPNITIVQEPGRKKRQVNMNENVLNVKVTVLDINDNNPDFGGNGGSGGLIIASKNHGETSQTRLFLKSFSVTYA